MQKIKMLLSKWEKQNLQYKDKTENLLKNLKKNAKSHVAEGLANLDYNAVCNNAIHIIPIEYEHWMCVTLCTIVLTSIILHMYSVYTLVYILIQSNFEFLQLFSICFSHQLL